MGELGRDWLKEEGGGDGQQFALTLQAMCLDHSRLIQWHGVHAHPRPGELHARACMRMCAPIVCVKCTVACSDSSCVSRPTFCPVACPCCGWCWRRWRHPRTAPRLASPSLLCFQVARVDCAGSMGLALGPRLVRFPWGAFPPFFFPFPFGLPPTTPRLPPPSRREVRSRGLQLPEGHRRGL